MSRSLTISAVVAVLFGCALGVGSAPAAVVSCPSTNVTPDAATLMAANDTILCLINAERAKRGIPRLKVSVALTRAAQRHSADMVRRQYFSHVSRGGSTPRQRIQRAGYRRAITVNETLAVGAAGQSTPAGLLKTLLDDLPHKRIVLSRAYREIGVGLVLGYPSSGAPEPTTTLTVTYGRR